MSKSILVTGGAGFIGSHLVDRLIKDSHDVTILDCLDPQVHKNNKIPDYLNKKATFVKGSVLDGKLLQKLLKDTEIIFHEAAVVGVGQSMYQVKHYIDQNCSGTAILLDVLVNKEISVKKIIVAASMSSYGEGIYSCEKCGVIFPTLRPEKQLQRKKWELVCQKCKSELKPLPTNEDKPMHSNSIYAISKKVQEEMVLNIGKSYSIPSTALRYFNAFGTRQSLNNPYTGIIAIFLNLIKNGKRPVIYEDGLQTRDFISVYDVVEANILSMNSKNSDYESFNVGTGTPTTIKSIAEILITLTKSNLTPAITQSFRKGDIMHCYADISKIKQKLGFIAKHILESGLKEIVDWSKNIKVEDNFDIATSKLKIHKLI